MKFRLLNKEERLAVDEDFKHFLIANGVSNEEWIALNAKNDVKATNLVGVFSDTVFQKVMEKIKVVELRAKSSLMVFHFAKEEIQLIGINAHTAATYVDLSSTESIHLALTKYASDLSFFKQSKAYIKERELEVFEMVEKGCVPSHIDFWNVLNKATEE
ncbi:MAG: DUF6495 family protein [Lishizhenia sp.]